MRVSIELVLDDIAEQIGREDAEELIITIDKMMADWEFTEKIAKYFAEQMEKFNESMRN